MSIRKLVISVFALSLAGCSVETPTGYELCTNFSKMSTGSFETPSTIGDLLAARLDGGSMSIVQDGSYKGLGFGPYPFPVVMFKASQGSFDSFKRAWVHVMAKGKVDYRAVLFWGPEGGYPIKEIEIPASVPDGTVREVDFTAPQGGSVAIVGLVGFPSLSGAVCLDGSSRAVLSRRSSPDTILKSLKIRKN